MGLDRRRIEIAHLPVSKETLDESVTVAVQSNAKFPDATDGIQQWRDAKGGVFTISVAKIVDILDQSTAPVDQSTAGSRRGESPKFARHAAINGVGIVDVKNHQGRCEADEHYAPKGKRNQELGVSTVSK